MALSIGTKFYSFHELNRVVKQFEKDNFVNLYKKESRTIEASLKRCTKRVFNSALKYGELSYACVRNGKYKARVTTGERPNQTTVRTGCKFTIKLRSYDGQSLQVNSHGPAHNHDCKREDFKKHPSQRRLDKKDIDEASSHVYSDDHCYSTSIGESGSFDGSGSSHKTGFGECVQGPNVNMAQEIDTKPKLNMFLEIDVAGMGKKKLSAVSDKHFISHRVSKEENTLHSCTQDDKPIGDKSFQGTVSGVDLSCRSNSHAGINAADVQAKRQRLQDHLSRLKTLPDFHTEVGHAWAKDFKSCVPRTQPSNGAQNRLTGRHFPRWIPSTPTKKHPFRVCFLCSSLKRKTGEMMVGRKRKETQIWCEQCGKALCAAPCFEIYHTVADI